MTTAATSRKVSAVDAAISASRCSPLEVEPLVVFASSDAVDHLEEIRAKCVDSTDAELATFIAARFLAIGLAAGQAVRDCRELEGSCV